MSEVITGVLKLTFGLISDKLRTYSAKKLKYGDFIDELFRGFIVRELDDIKSKLDAISRKDLCASISFLKQGVERLNLAFDKSVERGGPSSSELSSTGASSSVCSTSSKRAQPSVTIEDAVALASAIGKLKLDSNELFVSANESFKEAGKQATLTFHNSELTVEERILSSKVRIASSILEHLDHTEVAATDCLLYLQELHNMPEIQQVFLVHIQGGLKSYFKKTSRAEIVETVTVINLILADFITKFTKRRMAVFDWPQMQCGRQIVHLIHCEEESVNKMREIKITPPWGFVKCKTDDQLSLQEFAINSEGDIIRVFYEYNIIKKLERASGEWKRFWGSDDEVSSEKSLAIAGDGAIYVVSNANHSQSLAPFQDDNLLLGPTLSTYSSDGEIIHHRTLDFIRELPYRIAVTNDYKIVICCSGVNQVVVYICDIKGQLIERFDNELEGLQFLYDLFITCDNEITVALKRWNFDLKEAEDVVDFYVYSKEGKLKSTFTLRPPSFGLFGSIAFNHATKNYTICHQAISYDKICIEDISGAGSEFVRNSIFLDKSEYNIDDEYCKLVSHTNGAMALVSPKGVLYLQSSSK